MRREGTTIGQFRLERLLGHGGMGTVYAATDEMTGREVAVKLLRPDLIDQTDFVDRFKAEARTLARLDHPRIARLYGFFQHQDDLLMVMEFVRGATLAARIREMGRIEPASAAAWMGEVLEALQYAHEQGVIHRDVKPANIIIDPSGHARLTDFGIARSLGDNHLTQTGQSVGTVAYMAPEQMMASPMDGRVDLYAAAVVLFEMLAGAIPYNATTTFSLMREVSEGVAPAMIETLPSGAASLRPVLRRALHVDPTQRYPDAQALRDALAAVMPALPEGAVRDDLSGQVTQTGFALPAPAPAAGHATAAARDASPATPPEAAPAAASTTTRSRWLAPAAALALVAAMGLGAAVWRSAGLPPTGDTSRAETSPITATPAGAETSTAATSTGVTGPAAAPAPAAVTAAPAPVAAAPVAPGPSLASAPKAAAASGTETRTAAPRSASAATPEGRPEPRAVTETSSAGASAKAAGKAAASADAAPAEFTRVLMMVPVDDDTEEVDALLRFEARRLVVANAETRVPLKTISYGGIASATYSQVQRRFRGTAHWLDLNVGGEQLVLRLDKRNVVDILAALEARARLTVQKAERR